jgi:glycosyltransferase XagB
MAKILSVRAVDSLELAIGPKRLGDIFLELGYVDHKQLQSALEYQQQKGGRLGRVLASLGYINRLELYEGLAKHFVLPFETRLADIWEQIDKKLAVTLPHSEIVQHQVIPLSLENNTLTVLTSDPHNPSTITFLQKRFAVKNINQTVITDLDLMKLSQKLYRESILDNSINGLRRRYTESARIVFSREQIAFIAGFLCMFGVWLYFDPKNILLTSLFTVQLVFIIPVIFKLVITIYSCFKKRSLDIHIPVKPYNEHDLPVYSILIPVFKEKEVIGNLIKSIKRLDYPAEKLDIILLLEENDEETLADAKAEKPPANWRFLTCPQSLPQTKLKALNYGLNFVRGEYLAVLNAEDIPQPDQLKKAVAAFRTHTDNYFCFQSQVDYFNKNENLLTQMSALENVGWFDCILPGLSQARMPVFLYGTGTHYDVDKLRHIGGWDPFNVTGETDLGFRASGQGYKIGVIETTTFEEANPKFNNWLRQRSRWFKGYLQTFLVHNRHPLLKLKEVGFARWVSFNLLTGGMPFTFLLAPVMWLFMGLAICLNSTDIFSVSPALLYIMGLNLMAANVIIIVTAMLGIIPEKKSKLFALALFFPIYWFLQSLAAYKGLWQLLTKPFYWEKTEHGLTSNIPVSKTLEIPADIQELVVVKGNHKVNYVIK